MLDNDNNFFHKGAPKLFCTPRELTKEEIEEIIKRFSYTSSLLQKYGFDGVEIHAAHGYLLSQFLSPYTNQRSDEWGGTAEKRRKLLLSVIERVRETVGEKFIVGLKLNSSDFKQLDDQALEQGSENDVVELIRALQQQNMIDFIEITGGTYENAVMMQNSNDSGKEGFFLDFVSKIREHTTIPLILTGGFRTLQGMSSAIADHHVDMIGVARPYCWDPLFGEKLLSGAITSSNFNYNLQYGENVPVVRNFSHIFAPILNNLWYQRQMELISRNIKPNPLLGKLFCVTAMFFRTYVLDYSKRSFKRTVGVSSLFITSVFASLAIYFRFINRNTTTRPTKP